ncbi:receptor-like protein 13 isoform X2 [Jatropha curcas]|nr:receptor-like protein 13 isoform X2 [Jatropha curcas]
MSLFQHFKELRTLNLSYNYIGAFIDNEDVERLSSLKKLQILDLSHNEFDRSILSWIATLTSIKILNLGENFMGGSFPSRELANLQNLEILDLNSNKFSGTLPMQGFINFKSLEILDLSVNNLDATIPPYMWAPPSLRALSLAFNGNLRGSLSSLCNLKRLEELYLQRNMFGGNLPLCLCNLTSIRYLDLSNNSFRGYIPSSWLSNLKSLKYINLEQNLLEGFFSFSSFANHSSLEFVNFSDNKIEVETKYLGSVPPFQLQFLALKNCHLPRVPEFLYHQFKLKMIDLSSNRIRERFPVWLLENNTELDELRLGNNHFTDRLHLPSYSSFNISILDVSDNHLYGQLQIGEKMFPNIWFLNLSINDFQGDFLFSPEENCKLRSLDLSFNSFSGEIPKKMISSCISLQLLKLSHNNFHGEIFTARYNLTDLRDLSILYLNDNSFMGSLSSVTQFSSLQALDVSNNNFDGEIPLYINNSTIYVNLSHNFFNGGVPCQIFSATYIDLSYNNFSGSLPSCSNQSQYHYGERETGFINLQGNSLTGSIPNDFVNMSSLLTLNLKDNSLSGSISNKLGIFPNLRALLLGGNQLNGSIPNWLCELNELNILDLSRNSFSGSIPDCLYNGSFGRKPGDGDLFQTQLELLGIEGPAYPDEGVLRSHRYGGFQYDNIIVDPKIEFVTKYMAYNYKGHITMLMSGLDLSENKLTGEIPFELGKLSEIHALNLSHNHLIGSIPTAFSNLTALESLDLSCNNLRGEIPYRLIDITSLAVFNVSFNNLSGRIPDGAQFNTFDKKSYEGNPFLCGTLIEKKCSNEPPNPSPTPHAEPENEKWYEINHLVFFASFSVSFAIFFVGVITILLVNPYWRGRLFYHTEQFVFSFYYSVYDTFSKLLFGHLFH